jgi:choline dehydrogenase-like flavoprotein
MMKLFTLIIYRCYLQYYSPDDSCQLESMVGVRGIRRIRIRRVLVHPASTMWIGDDSSSPVDQDYRFRGVENVYLTGTQPAP